MGDTSDARERIMQNVAGLQTANRNVTPEKTAKRKVTQKKRAKRKVASVTAKQKASVIQKAKCITIINKAKCTTNGYIQAEKFLREGVEDNIFGSKIDSQPGSVDLPAQTLWNQSGTA